MPTAAKLAAMLAFAAIGFLAAEAYKPGFETPPAWGLFSPIVALIGAGCGWFVMGGLVGRGYMRSAGSGVRTSATMVFWAILGFSTYQMIIQSTRMMYGGVFEAIEGTFDLMLRNGGILLRVEPIAVLMLGGMLGGMLAEWANRRWR
jgi:hypothetical protein